VTPAKAPRYDVPRAAPQPLRIVQEFINTTDREHGREWLGTPAVLAEWLAARGIEPPATNADGDVERAHELREALRVLIRANNGVGSEAEALDVVNGFAERALLGLHATPAGVELVVGADGIDGALGGVVRVVFLAMLDGTWWRLKGCRNDHCTWAFYDASKNRSASWCSMQLCGNRLKTRSYRRRRSHDAG